MIQVVLFLITVALVAAGFAWVADRPGDVAIVWMGYRVETSLMVAAQRSSSPACPAQARAGAILAASPALAWAGQAVLDDRCAATDWSGALDALDHMKSALEKTDYRRKRAVLLTARALALQDIDLSLIHISEPTR